MRILIAHVQYRYRGGEDAVVETEARLLRAAGHDVRTLNPLSSEFDHLALGIRLNIALNAGDHAYGRDLIRRAIEDWHPEVVHFHNLYPLLGVGAIAEAACMGCATVQTLHNYRLSCVAGTHFRNGAVCEECRPGKRAAGVRHGCYRGSRLQSFAMTRAAETNWRLLERKGLPHRLLCLTPFMYERLTQSGVPKRVLQIKPNSVDDSQSAPGWSQREGAVFVGRLSAEKGVLELIDSWPDDNPPLRIVGEGPLGPLVDARCAASPNVTFVGPLGERAVRVALGEAKVLLLASRCYEGLPLTLLESLAEGTPLVAFRLGAMQLIADVGDHLLADVGDFVQLTSLAREVCRMSESDWSRLSKGAHRLHAERFTHEASVAGLEAAYSTAIERAETTSKIVPTRLQVQQPPVWQSLIHVAGLSLARAGLQAASAQILEDAQARTARVFALINAHSAKLRRESQPYAIAVADTERVVGLPDGASLTFAARLLGCGDIGRCPGPDLLEVTCARAAQEEIPIFLLGGEEGVADALAAALRSRHSGLLVAGTATPPFSEWPEKENRRLVRAVKDSGARILWMGVSAPRQEIWAHRHVDELDMPIVCVGAAFDFNTGRKSRAPAWMRRMGLEWLHRLMTEPRRTWKRYLVGNTLFVWDVIRYGRRPARTR